MNTSLKHATAAVTSVLIGLSAQAGIALDFTNLTGVGNGTFTVNNVGSAPTIVDSDSNTYNDAIGSFSGVTGSFSFTISALGTKDENFNTSDFTGGAAKLVESSGLTVQSDIGLGSLRPGQGLVFSFDLTGLVGASEITLTDMAFTSQNSDEFRGAFRNEGTATPSIIYSGISTVDTTINSSSDLLAVYKQPGTTDRINRKLLSLTFNAVPEPTSYALISGLAALSALALRRRR